MKLSIIYCARMIIMEMIITPKLRTDPEFAKKFKFNNIKN